MKTTSVLLALCLLCGAVSCARTPNGVGVGSASPAAFDVPDAFHRANEGEDTIFLMPRRDDVDGPISMRLTCLQDLRGADLTDAQIAELLKKFNPGSKIMTSGKNTYTTQTSQDTDPDGTHWHYRHFTIYVDGLIVTATAQTIKGRESEPQCEELLSQVQGLLASLRRETG
jgi:hypothetical protein